MSWGGWLQAAFPFGVVFFLVSFGALTMLYHPQQLTRLRIDVVDAQLKTLGPMTMKEKVALATIVLLVTFLILTRLVLGDSFARLEQSDTTEHVERAEHVERIEHADRRDH